MLLTLALFLSAKERKNSRTVPKGEIKRYIPNLFVQGYLKKVTNCMMEREIHIVVLLDVIYVNAISYNMQ